MVIIKRKEEIETTKNGIYKLVVIGGGPAGVGLFVRAARIGLLSRLLNPTVFGTSEDLELSQELNKNQLGVAVVHDGDEGSFGAGNLGAFKINSNTFAKSFVSSILDTRSDLCPPETIEGTFLQNIVSHAATKKLQKVGMAPCLLEDLGCFLNVVGSQLSKEIAKPVYRDTSHCLFDSRAFQLHLLKDTKGRNYVRVDIVSQITNTTISIFAENIVLAVGGKQLRPKLPHPSLDQKLFLSDFCLREEGMETLRQHLLRAKSSSVCIVGGSHSAFSVAWLLLHRLTKKTQPVAVQKLLSASKNADSVRALNHTSEILAIHNSNYPADDKNGTDCTSQIEFGRKDITILHRSAIKCFYMNRKEAEANCADATFVDRCGSVNTFTGLREDSKRLYKDILNKKERRVRLFQVQEKGNQSLSLKAYESAAAIIWCCGYATNLIPAFNINHESIQFSLEHGVVKLNSKAQVLIHRESLIRKATLINKCTPTYQELPNIFGIGIGFHLRASVDESGGETRADGVTVYHRRGATLILATLFGHSVFGGENKSYDEMVENVGYFLQIISGRRTHATFLTKNDKIRKEGAFSVLETTEKRTFLEQIASRYENRSNERHSGSSSCSRNLTPRLRDSSIEKQITQGSSVSDHHAVKPRDAITKYWVRISFFSAMSCVNHRFYCL